ncbi:MAG: hypothetical protein Kow0029_07220 [Candidatus Rifleibacteriota bacterium]
MTFTQSKLGQLKLSCIIILFLSAFVLDQAYAASNWVVDKEMNFKIKVPNNYQKKRFNEGTDTIHAFLSPDQNVAIRIRAIPIKGNLAVDKLVQIFEQNVIKGSQRLLIDDYKLNSLSGKICGYKWKFNNVPVGLAVFFTVQNNFAYVIWSIIPVNLFKQRTAEGDAIINTFALLKNGNANSSKSLFASKAKNIKNKKPEGSQVHSSPSKKEFFDLVSDDAMLTHKVPTGFKLEEKLEGQSIWKNELGVKMVIQTITAQENFESFVDGLIKDIKSNGATVASNMYTVENGLKVANYSYKYGDNYFAYGATKGNNVFYLVGFVGKLSQKDTLDTYSEEANMSLKKVH